MQGYSRYRPAWSGYLRYLRYSGYLSRIVVWVPCLTDGVHGVPHFLVEWFRVYSPRGMVSRTSQIGRGREGPRGHYRRTVVGCLQGCAVFGARCVVRKG